MFLPGLLAKAHRGILYVDDINLLDTELCQILLGIVADGWVNVEVSLECKRLSSRSSVSSYCVFCSYLWQVSKGIPILVCAECCCCDGIISRNVQHGAGTRPMHTFVTNGIQNLDRFRLSLSVLCCPARACLNSVRVSQ